MGIIRRVVKPKTHKGKKAILKREPKIVEDAKQTICIKGKQTSQLVNDFVKDIYDLKKPDAHILGKKNEIFPFDNIVPIEQFTRKNNAPLFLFTSHNKKRPHNIVIGRTYEHTLLDMVEFGLENYKGLKDFKIPKISSGIKPMLVFNGEIFETNSDFKRMKNLFIDLFQRDNAQKVRLQGLEHVLSFTADGNKILLRSYRVLLKKSDSHVPRIELEEIGPRADLVCRRTKLASDDLFKQACKKAKELKVKTKKNISEDKLGTTLGRIHLGKQNINSIQTRKMKGLKKTYAEKKAQRKNSSKSDTTKSTEAT